MRRLMWIAMWVCLPLSAACDVQPGGVPARLSFKHKEWFTADLLADGIAPNGVQIEDNVL